MIDDADIEQLAERLERELRELRALLEALLREVERTNALLDRRAD